MRKFFGLKGPNAAAGRGAAALTAMAATGVVVGGLIGAPGGAAAQDAPSAAAQFGPDALAALRGATQTQTNQGASARAAVEQTVADVVAAYYQARPDYDAAYSAALDDHLHNRMEAVRFKAAETALNALIAEGAAAESAASQDTAFDVDAAAARLLLAERIAQEFARLNRPQSALQAQFAAIGGRRAMTLYALSDADDSAVGVLAAEAERPLEPGGAAAYPIQSSDGALATAPALTQAVEAATSEPAAAPELPAPQIETPAAAPPVEQSPSLAVAEVEETPVVETPAAPRVLGRRRIPAPPRLRANRRPIRPAAPISGRIAPVAQQDVFSPAAPPQAQPAPIRVQATVRPAAARSTFTPAPTTTARSTFTPAPSPVRTQPTVRPIARTVEPQNAFSPRRVSQRFAAAAPRAVQPVPEPNPPAVLTNTFSAASASAPIRASSFGASPVTARTATTPFAAAPTQASQAAPFATTSSQQPQAATPFAVAVPSARPEPPRAATPFEITATSAAPAPSQAATPFEISSARTQPSAQTFTPRQPFVAAPVETAAASTSAASATVRTAPSLDSLVAQYRRLIADSEQAKARFEANLPMDLEAADARLEAARKLSVAFAGLGQFSLQNQAILLRDTEERRLAIFLGRNLGVISEERDAPLNAAPSVTPSTPVATPFTVAPPQPATVRRPLSIDRVQQPTAPLNVVFSGPPVDASEENAPEVSVGETAAETALAPDPVPAPAATRQVAPVATPTAAPRPAAPVANDPVERRLQLEASRRADLQTAEGVAVVMAAAAAPGEGPRLTEGELRGVLAKLSNCWNLPPERSSGLTGAMASIGMSLDEQGRVQPASVRVLSSDVPGGGSIQPVLEAARRMLSNPSCQPFDLPAAKRDSWRRMVITLQMRAQE